MSGFSVNPKWHPTLSHPETCGLASYSLLLASHWPASGVPPLGYGRSHSQVGSFILWSILQRRRWLWTRNRHYSQQLEIDTGQTKETEDLEKWLSWQCLPYKHGIWVQSLELTLNKKFGMVVQTCNTRTRVWVNPWGSRVSQHGSISDISVTVIKRH